MRILLRLSALAWRYPWQIGLAYVCLLGSVLAALAVPRLLGDAIDHALSSQQYSTLVTLAIAILAVSALRGVLAYGQTYLGEGVSQRVAYALRNALYDKLQNLSFAFHDQQRTGDLMSRGTADVEGIRFFIQMGLLRLAQLVVMIGGASALMFAMNWRLALVSMAFVPFAAWRTALIRIALQRTWLRIQSLLGEMTTVLQENLTGARAVRAFGAEEYEKDKFNAKAQATAESSYKANMLQAANNSEMTLAYAIALGGLLLVGGYEYVAGRLTAGQLTQFIFYHSLLAMPVRLIGMVVNVIARAQSAGKRLFDVLDAESPVREKPDARDIGRAQGYVRFHNVSFAYREDAAVLKDVDFEARPGQVMALLGAPGSGKTTVVHLIPRFYDASEGAVTIDGADVRDMTLDSLRRNVGIVMQDVFVFSATIRQNIAYGHPEATDEDVIRASRIAQLHDFIATLPDGYDTLVGERGVTLSGGQRQRLAIARSVLLDPSILILDDTMSSVDAETESRLKVALADVMRGRTTFVIAHRLSTVLSAAQILVLDEGVIAERGTHQELLAKGGLYRQIYEAQLLPQEELAGAGKPVNGRQADGAQAMAATGPGMRRVPR